MIEGFVDELVKIGQRRSYVKDVLGGIDPTGGKTFAYGVHDAPVSKEEASKRRTAATVGGAIGGSLAIPMAVGGALGIKKGLRGVLSGAVSPFTAIRGALKATGVLKKIENRTATTEDITKALSMLKGKVKPELLEKILGPRSIGTASRVVKHIPPSYAGYLRKQVQSRLGTGLGAIGASGAFGAGSAYLQYGKGRQAGELMDPRKRRQYS